MALPLPDAPDPPSFGQLIVYGFYGIGIAVAAFLARAGFLQGRRSPEPGTDHAEIAGAVISDAKADELIAAFNRNTAALNDVAGAIGEGRQDLRDLTLELARAGRGRTSRT